MPFAAGVCISPLGGTEVLQTHAQSSKIKYPSDTLANLVPQPYANAVFVGLFVNVPA